jgi:hypothetical protein
MLLQPHYHYNRPRGGRGAGTPASAGREDDRELQDVP